MEWLLIVLLTLAGASRAVSDAQAHGSARLTAWFPKWAGPDAWRNKYRNYYLDTKTPAFWCSTTVLVALTDLWHFSNAVTWACADAAFLLAAYPVYHWYAVAAVVVRRVVFEPLYSFLRKS